MCWDHPRVRGEHVLGTLEIRFAPGSSPRARGAPPRRGGRHLQRGIIPACAGSTHAAIDWCQSDEGSSPRARGARDPAASLGEAAGIIPACAGSTGTTCTPPTGSGDHPRVRGEHACGHSAVIRHGGSSPRARGALWSGSRDRWGRGIIPACAGSTPGDRPGDWPPGDHPRVRGEHQQTGHPGRVHQGSSPRARGARDREAGSVHSGGIIPACAGSTTRSGARTAWRRDHPRVRGEHSLLS